MYIIIYRRVFIFLIVFYSSKKSTLYWSTSSFYDKTYFNFYILCIHCRLVTKSQLCLYPLLYNMRLKPLIYVYCAYKLYYIAIYRCLCDRMKRNTVNGLCTGPTVGLQYQRDTRNRNESYDCILFIKPILFRFPLVVDSI